MKKFAILLSAMMILALAACAPSVPKDPQLIQETTSTAPLDTLPETTADTTADGTTSDTTPPVTSETPPAASASGAAIAALAEEQLGVPFASGGSSPESGFDNPGFIAYVLNNSGITAERTVVALATLGSAVEFSQLQAGDILFFASEEAGESPSFGGIYIGDGNMVYAPVPDELVKTATVTSPYWSKRFVTARRVGAVE